MLVGTSLLDRPPEGVATLLALCLLRQFEIAGLLALGDLARTGVRQGPQGCRDLLEGIADGTVDLRSPDVAARAAVEADYLRTELGLTPPAAGPVGQLVRRMVRTAARTGATVEVELLSDFTREDAYPDEVAQILDDVIAGLPRNHFVLHGFADAGQEELVLVIPAGPDHEPASTVVGDTTIQIVPSDTEVHIMIRRPQA